MITYTLSGDPVPLARARTNHHHIYDAQQQLKLCMRQELSNQHDNRPLYSGPLHIDMIFYMRIPKNSRKNMAGRYHTFKPDLDNLAKLVCDISTPILFANDSIVASMTCKKIYGKVSHTEFSITEIKNSDSS